ncbi:MAG: FtsX-like permease family protein, partial [Nitrospirota bacterium]|nr:FtsX-like permease family protein [Nitrospirota bacterium]
RQIDNVVLKANLQVVKELQYTDDVHSIVMLLRDTEYTNRVSKFLHEEFEKNNLDVVVKTWEDLAETYHQVVNLYKASFNVVTIIILLIVIFSIANTLYMSVMERVREIGTFMAIGSPKAIIIRLFLLEGVVIGTVGTGLGIFIAFMASKLINSLYIMMPPPPGATEGYPLSIFVNFLLAVKVIALNIVTSFLASLYPALKASKLKIVDALRYV